MPREKKHPRLPNGFGSIKKLSGNRSNPYAVYPPSTGITESGSPITQQALCYVPDWYTGFHALLEYRNGTFDAEKFKNFKFHDTDKEFDIVSKILASYNATNRIKGNEFTFSKVYELFYADKFENTNGKKKFSKQSQRAYQWAYKQCESLYDRPMRTLAKNDMQTLLDNCTLGYGSLNHLRNLFSQMFRYAMQEGIVDTDYSKFVSINSEKDFESGEPFTEDEIRLLWEHKENHDIQIILLMIYTGMRISELKMTEIDFESNCFKGGLKTAAGKDRIIPFPDKIIDFIRNFRQDSFNAGTFRDKKFYPLIQSIGMPPMTNGKKHTPHDCRHTFSWLCDKYGVDELSKHLLMGHSLGKDVEKSVYGHRTVDQLRDEINKLIFP